MNRQKAVDILIGALVVCAVVVTVLVIRRETVDRGTAHGGAPTTVETWREYAEAGQRLGPEDARVTVIVFSDFQCPACKRLSERLTLVREQFPHDMAIIYRHYPIEQIHPHARQAALASECAAAQGQFWAFHDVLFRSQDLIGSRDWKEFARSASVPHLSTFGRCFADPTTETRIEEDVAAARNLGISGTPLVLINSSRFHGAPPVEELQKMVTQALEQ